MQRNSINLSLEPPSASASLDGLPIEDDVRVPAGRHLLLVEAQNHTPQTRRINLAPGEQQSISIRLRPTRQVEPSPSEMVPDTNATEYPYRQPSVLLGAASLAVGATGLTIFAWNDQRYRQWRRDDRQLRTPRASSEPDYEARVSEHNALLQSIHRYDTTTWLMAGLGGVLAVTGGVLFFWSEPKNSTSAWLTPGTAGYQATW